MKQIIRYSGQDFTEHPDKDRMIELAMMRECNGVFNYELAKDCYKRMFVYYRNKARKNKKDMT